MHPLVRALAQYLDMGGLLAEVRNRFGGYEILEHWTQGEFHHDVVIRVPLPSTSLATSLATSLPGPILVVATNCNGGVKELLSFAAVPDRSALWHWRCPEVSDFAGELGPILARAVTMHWFDPCELLTSDARSELREEFRARQLGGGWELSTPPACAKN